MAGRRHGGDDPTVDRWRNRQLGIKDQAQIEADRRAEERIAGLGDEEARFYTVPINTRDDVIITKDSLTAFRIEGDDGTGRIQVNTYEVMIAEAGEPAQLTLNLLNGMGLVLFSDEFVTGVLTIDGVNGNIDSQGNITLAGNLTVGGAVDAALGLAGNTDQWQAGYHSDPGASTLSTVGMPAPTTAGTLSNFVVADGPGLTFTTTAVLNNVASVVTAANWRTGWGFDAVFRIRTGSDLTNLRYWVGLFASDPSGSSTPNINYAGFRFDSGVPDTNWMVRACGGGGATSGNDSGVAVAANTTYTMRLVSEDGTSIAYYIDGVLVGTVTTNLPTTTTLLASRLSVTTLAAETNALRVHHVKVVSR